MKLYIETSVPNMLFAEDAPEKRAATEVFFDWLRVADDDLFSSEVVKKEIDRASEPKRSRMVKAFAGLPITVLDITNEAVGLSEIHVREGITPVRYQNDALHVALAVCHTLDVVVSWNMKHLVNVRKVQRINAVNLRYGLPAIRVHTPEEITTP
jgi:predicted nucleic acid-binding protein